MREALLDEPETLLVVSCYHIGKERAFLGAAGSLGLKVGEWAGQSTTEATATRWWRFSLVVVGVMSQATLAVLPVL